MSWLCPHCGEEIAPDFDPEEYEWFTNEYGEMTGECPHCEGRVTVRCIPTYRYEVVGE